MLLLLTSSMTNPTGALLSRSFELQGKGWQKKSSDAGIYGNLSGRRAHCFKLEMSEAGR